MSINDLLNSEGFLLALLAMIGFMGIIFFIAIGLRALERKDEIATYDVKTIPAKVISRQMAQNPSNRLTMVNIVIFESEDNQRLEFSIQDASMIAGIVEGDTGMLQYQGPQFISFRREENS